MTCRCGLNAGEDSNLEGVYITSQVNQKLSLLGIQESPNGTGNLNERGQTLRPLYCSVGRSES